MSRRKTTSRLAGLDFKEEFEVFSANVNRAARAFYYNIALNEYALADDKNICILNEAAQFWNDFRDSTVVTVFILLGRIFDKPQGARNIDKLLQIAEKPYDFP